MPREAHKFSLCTVKQSVVSNRPGSHPEQAQALVKQVRVCSHVDTPRPEEKSQRNRNLRAGMHHMWCHEWMVYAKAWPKLEIHGLGFHAGSVLQGVAPGRQ